MKCLYDEESELAEYLWHHFAPLFTPVEHKAYWAVIADGKARLGHEHIRDFIWRRHKLAEDPAVMAELADGVDAFRRRAAQRVLRERSWEVFVNRCAACGRVVATPKAQQCLWCGHDWHPGAKAKG